MPLDPIGMPGSTSMAIPSVMLLASGSATITWTVPNVTATLDEDVQALCLDPGANASGATVSNSMRTFLGY